MKKFDEIVKYKNGNIVLYPNKEYDIDSYYYDIMFLKDLYIENIGGYSYIYDYNTHRMYDLSILGHNCMQNVLTWLDKELKKGKIRLCPISKKEQKSLMQDMENGY